MSGKLHKYFLNNGGKPIHKWFHYFDIYEHHLQRFKGKSPVILEIGVQAGGSLQMWKDYFDDDCRVVGLDISPECKDHEEEGVEVFIGKQHEPKAINQILEKYPHIDIVIDDGGHISWQMINCFDILYNKISANGTYIVEDTHACYWPSHAGGLKHPQSFIEHAKNKIDEVNAGAAKLPTTEITKNTNSISFYDSVVVFEKRLQGIKQDARTRGYQWT